MTQDDSLQTDGSVEAINKQPRYDELSDEVKNDNNRNILADEVLPLHTAIVDEVFPLHMGSADEVHPLGPLHTPSADEVHPLHTGSADEVNSQYTARAQLLIELFRSSINNCKTIAFKFQCY